MSDLIERQDAIDAILAVTGNSSVRELYEHVQEHGLSEMWSGGVNAAIDIIIAVPPVRPEPCEDTISRKAAIDAVKHAWAKGLEPTQYIEDLPSAQPDMSEYSDKLWKAAYERGKAEALDKIVRCKDCKQFRRWIDTDICFCDITEAEMSDNDFCSKAERITDGV